MKLLSTPLKGAAAVLASVVLLSSCKKEMPVAPKTTTGTSVNSPVKTLSMLEIALSDVTYLASVNNLHSGKMADANSILSDCAVITDDSINGERVIDYGTTGCLCGDDKTRYGIIRIHYNTGTWQSPGATFTSTYENFTVNTTQWAGTITAVNNGYNGNGNLTFSGNINVQVTPQGETMIDGSANLNVEWTAGQATTDNKDDDEYVYSGTLNATQGSTTASMEILTGAELLQKHDCNDPYVAGEIKIVMSGNPDKFIDFGNGECDGSAIQTENGVSSTISLE